ncbi:hypothetical protein AGMMS49531_09910 [Endomicrobiia bacterium]|nr:hypothetical protein AGMMS49531_09910 [Endomicrobiia bacterium]
MKKAKTRRSRLCIKNVLAIIVMFACTSICFGTIKKSDDSNNAAHREDVVGNSKTLNASNATDGEDVAGNSDRPDGTANDANIFPLDPNGCTLTINQEQ